MDGPSVVWHAMMYGLTARMRRGHGEVGVVVWRGVACCMGSLLECGEHLPLIVEDTQCDRRHTLAYTLQPLRGACRHGLVQREHGRGDGLALAMLACDHAHAVDMIGCRLAGLRARIGDQGW
jgi:hypothetical protein